MKTLKLIGYYALFFLYWLICFAFITYGFEMSGTPNGIPLLFSIIAIGSPFLVTKWFINKFYPGANKKASATLLAIVVIVLMCLHGIGGYISKEGITETYIPFYAFDVFLIITLFLFKPQIKTI